MFIVLFITRAVRRVSLSWKSELEVLKMQQQAAHYVTVSV